MSLFARYARYYDCYYAGKDYAGECDFIAAACARYGRVPGRVLDLACGTGGHGILMAERGCAVTGLDRSAEMLARCEEKARLRGVRVELSRQDLRSFSLPERFDTAICMFDAVGYLEENADLAAFLRRVPEHLEPGGLFLFDFWHAAPTLRSHDPVRVREFRVGERRLVRISSTTLDAARQAALVSFHVLAFEGDRLVEEFTEVHPVRYFLPREMAFILEATGWELLRLCPAFDLDRPVDESAWHLAAVATPARPGSGP